MIWKSGVCIVLAGILSSCGSFGRIGAGAVGVRVTNECAKTIYVGAVDSALSLDPLVEPLTALAPGARTHPGIITFAGYFPEDFYLVIQVEGKTVVARQFDPDALVAETPIGVFADDCESFYLDDQQGLAQIGGDR